MITGELPALFADFGQYPGRGGEIPSDNAPYVKSCEKPQVVARIFRFRISRPGTAHHAPLSEPFAAGRGLAGGCRLSRRSGQAACRKAPDRPVASAWVSLNPRRCGRRKPLPGFPTPAATRTEPTWRARLGRGQPARSAQCAPIIRGALCARPRLFRIPRIHPLGDRKRTGGVPAQVRRLGLRGPPTSLLASAVSHRVRPRQYGCAQDAFKPRLFGSSRPLLCAPRGVGRPGTALWLVEAHKKRGSLARPASHYA